MFENLKSVLGEAYHDNMTAEEVNSFFAGKSFADLSTGQYVDKNKYDRDIQNLNNSLTAKQNALNEKLTDSEKDAQDRQKDKDEIARLTQLLKDNSIMSNKDVAGGIMASVKTLLDIKEDDSDFATFMDTIVTDDRDKTSSLVKYVSKLTNSAYEKGKKDAMKDSMGDFGKGKKGDGANKNTESLGSLLAKQAMQSKNNVDYFKRS